MASFNKIKLQEVIVMPKTVHTEQLKETAAKIKSLLPPGNNVVGLGSYNGSWCVIVEESFGSRYWLNSIPFSKFDIAVMEPA